MLVYVPDQRIGHHADHSPPKIVTANGSSDLLSDKYTRNDNQSLADILKTLLGRTAVPLGDLQEVAWESRWKDRPVSQGLLSLPLQTTRSPPYVRSGSHARPHPPQRVGRT